MDSMAWVTDRVLEMIKRGELTGLLTGLHRDILNSVMTWYSSYFASLKPVTYYDDLSSKNVMIDDGQFSGLVDLDGLEHGDYLEAVGRIKASWYGTRYGEVYTNAIAKELKLN